MREREGDKKNEEVKSAERVIAKKLELPVK